MESIGYFYLSSDDDLDEKIVRRKLRDTSNPLSLCNTAFIKNFRLNKEAIQYVLSRLHFACHLSTAVPPILQLAATLSLLATGGYQHSVGSEYLIGMCQSTVSKITTKVLDEMEIKLCFEHIKFTPANSGRCKQWFMEKYKIPGVIGCVDGTHIGLQRPCENEHMFFNRKGYHSLNAMIICDHEHFINAVNARYGGAAHDSFVWKHSAQRQFLEVQFRQTENKNSWLLGDSGYPLEPWCITPYRNPIDGSSKSNFNEVHSKARCIIERTIGILKGRWRMLGYGKRGRYNPEKLSKIINVCSALHNICIQFKIPYNPKTFKIESVPVAEIELGEGTQLTAIGERIREHIRLSLNN